MSDIRFDFKLKTSEMPNIETIKVNNEEDDAVVTVESGKLLLSKSAIKLLGAEVGDKIAINYWTQNSENTFPLIGKAEFFTDRDNGNRLTKSNTVSFRGVQRDILLEYGSSFKLVPFNNYFKMEKVEVISENDLLEEEERDLANLI